MREEGNAKIILETMPIGVVVVDRFSVTQLLLQTRTKVLNNELDEVFRGWYPRFREQAA